MRGQSQARPHTSMDDFVTNVTGARSIVRRECIQPLWSGYGEIMRVHLEGTEVRTAIVKSIHPLAQRSSDVSHTRKCKSYDLRHLGRRRLGREDHRRTARTRRLGARDLHRRGREEAVCVTGVFATMSFPANDKGKATITHTIDFSVEE